MKYWIIDLEGYGMSENTREARGPFKSIADAEKWLKADAEENFRSMNELERLGEDRKWAVPVLIVEEKKKMQQIPVIDVKINLEEAK
jgi:hypothetical protein